MASLIDVLRQEHESMARLLDALERQIDRFAAGEQPDYEIVQGITEYFCDFPDLCHHPKEDFLAETLIDQGAPGAEALKGLAGQHADLAALTRRFAAVVQRVLDEAELPRNLLVGAGREFLEAQRLHMQMEEKHFFPFAEAQLLVEELPAGEAEAYRRQDPLFGPAAEARYARLRDDILAWERDGSQDG